MEDLNRLFRLVNDLRKLHHDFYNHLSLVGDRMKQQKYSPSELVDLGFLCREAETLLDDWRKDAKARKEIAGSLIAMKVTQDSVSNPNTPDTVKGTLARATAQCRMAPVLPSRTSPEYIMLLKSLGFTDQVIGKKYVDIHWKHLEEHVTELAEAGLPMPSGLGKTFPTFTATFTRLSK